MPQKVLHCLKNISRKTETLEKFLLLSKIYNVMCLKGKKDFNFFKLQKLDIFFKKDSRK